MTASEGYNFLINEVKQAKCVKEKQTAHYEWLKHYNILNIRGKEKLMAT